MFLFDIEKIEEYGLYLDNINNQSLGIGPVKIFGNISDGDYVIIDSTKCYVGFNVNNIGSKKVCLIASEKAQINLNLPIIRTKNLPRFVDIVMTEKRQKYNGKVVTITGSVGKTSTTNLIYSSLNLFGTTFLSIKHNLRNGIYSKLNLLKNENYAVFEVALGAVSSVSQVLESHVAVLLTIGEAHLDRFESLEDLAMVKAKIFEGGGRDSKAVINTDIPFFDKIRNKAHENNRKIITYGTKDFSDFKLESFTNNKLNFKFRNEYYCVVLKCHEIHQASNFLANLAVLESLDLNWKEYLQTLADLQDIEEGRGNEIDFSLDQNRNVKFIDHAYNSSPLALKETLKSFHSRNFEKGKKIAVLSDMLELGSESQKIHQDIIENSKEFINIDQLILVGDYMSKVNIDSENIIKFKNFDEVFSFLDLNLSNGDNVFFKASNGTKLRNHMLAFVESKRSV